MIPPIERVTNILHGLRAEERQAAEFLLESGTAWPDVAAIVLARRDRQKLRKLVQAQFPQLSEREAERALDRVKGERSFGFSPKRVFEESVRPALERRLESKTAQRAA